MSLIEVSSIIAFNHILTTMKNTLLLSLLTIGLTYSAFAGGVRGSIRDNEGNPLEFAAIYVKETGDGAVTNADGYYELRLAPGDYTLIFQYLGYNAEVRQVAVGDGFREIDVTMKSQSFTLKQVDVIEGREDPAYTVMRKAIAKASYHRQQLDSYSAQVYIKGSGRLKKAPFFIRKELKKEGIDSTFAFVSESVSRIEYKRPNNFKETVISIRKQGDDNSTSPSQFIFSSFYQPRIAESAVSPLSTDAFAYYKFKLDGYFMDRGYGVNKIRVIPRSRGEDVFDGYIYIVEDWWSIHSLSLKTYKFGIEFNINQVYAPIEDLAWMPTSQRFDVNAKVFGFDFVYNYVASVSGYKIKLNPDLPSDVAVIDEKLDQDLAKEVEKRWKEDAKSKDVYDKLSSGKELTRKDLRTLMKDYEKEEKKAAKADKTTELKNDETKKTDPVALEERVFKVDSMAYKRDSSYWAEIRPIPLTEYEVKGYERVDSLSRVEAEKREREESGEETDEKEAEKAKKKKKANQFELMDLIGGGSYNIGKARLSFESIPANIHFNPVEGFSLHSEIALRFNQKVMFKDTTNATAAEGSKPKPKVRVTREWTFGYTPRYAFAREKLTGKGRINYGFGRRFRRGHAQLEGGRYIVQYNSEKPISELINTYLNLFEERNFIRLYEKDYVGFNFDKQIRENWKFLLNAEWAKRYTLENNTSQTWFNRDDRFYDSNIPVNNEVTYPLPAIERASTISVGIEARPWQRYRTYNGYTRPIDNSSPTLTLKYRKGINGLFDSQVDYDLLDFTYRHDFKVGARGKMDVKVNTGIFLNNNYVGFADYKHFNGNRISLVTADPVGSFRLLDYYRHSTADKYLSAHAHYQFRKFLFTQITEVWLMGLKENLFVNYLATPTSQNYVELGYSVDNIFRIFRLETAVSFQDGKYLDWGVLIGISSNLGFIDFD